MLGLPDFNALSDEHDDILALPLDASYLVTGPPGTGKTIMAMYRANMLQRSGRKPLLLMYGRLLSSYAKAAIRELELDGMVSTYHSWFIQFWKRCYGTSPPQLGPWLFDWGACLDKVMTNPPPANEFRHFLIDEGQDIPRDFYIIIKCISKSIAVFADDNQRITDQQSTIAEICAATGIRQVLRLTKNHRNTQSIAEFAFSFYTGLLSGTPEVPSKSPRGDLPFLLSHATSRQTIDFISDYEKSHRDQSIGVLLERKWQVKNYYSQLLGRTRGPVQLYLSRDTGDSARYPQIDFANPGIKLLTYRSVKGLEFDAIFLPELQELSSDPRDDDTRMLFYVISSRAKNVLGLMYTGHGVPRLVDGLPLKLMGDLRRSGHVL